MIGIGESYIGAYVLACGLTERYAGLIISLPLGIASLLQLFSGQVLRIVKNRRWLVMIFALLQAFTLFLITGHSLFDRESPYLLILVLTLYWFFGLSAGPVWNAWIVAIIPYEHRTRFFSKRGPFHEVSVLIGLMAGGLLLSRSENPLLVFSLLFVVAGLSRMISVYSMFHLPDEPQNEGISFATPFDLRAFLVWLKQKNVVWMILLLGSFNLGVSIGSPFFTPFILRRLQLDYDTYMFLVALPFISRALAYSFHEKLVRRWGVKTVLLPAMAFISIMPLLWGYLPRVEWLILIQIIAGLAWTGFEYSILIKQLSDFSHSERSRVLTWTNLFIGLCNISGVLTGSIILGAQPQFSDYVKIFEISSLMRFFSILVVFAIDWKVSSLYVTKIYMRIVGVRANKGSVSKPILYVEDKE